MVFFKNIKTKDQTAIEWLFLVQIFFMIQPCGTQPFLILYGLEAVSHTSKEEQFTLLHMNDLCHFSPKFSSTPGNDHT